MAHDGAFTAQASMRNDLCQYGFLRKVRPREVATSTRSFSPPPSADTTKGETKGKIRSLFNVEVTRLNHKCRKLNKSQCCSIGNRSISL